MSKFDFFHLAKSNYVDNEEIAELDTKVTLFASYGAMFLAIGAFITLSIVRPFSFINVLAGVCVINVVFDNFFVERYFGRSMKKAADTYCVAFLMATMPIQWFGTGGFKGVGGLWMIFAAVYCIFGVRGKARGILGNVYKVEIIVILVINILHPEYVTEIDTIPNYIISFFSIIGIGIYIQMLQMLQNNEFLQDRKELTGLQLDITAHYEQAMALNDELINTAEKLEVANRTQKSFTASMNHELRAPLNGIEGCLQILLMDESLSFESKEMVKNALTASKTINETVNDLLDFAKLDEGKFEIVKRPFDLRDILDNVSTIFRPQASANNLKFYIQIPKESRVSLVGDGVRIQQIMTNLISNGIKYTKEGSVIMTITTERGHLKFDVKDTGQGMSKESVDTLFDPFTRFNLEENVHVQGTGLGMNIVANLIKQMKGEILVESEIGVGTVFHVDIPIMFYDSAITYSSPRTQSSMDFNSVNLSEFKVLCVDDTEINCTVFKGLLKKTGAHVTIADSGKKAISLCEEQGFDIIFIDHMMPEMDGLETMDHIRAIGNGRFEHIPIIMFTGNTSEAYRKMYEKRGANGILMKPIMFEDLISCFGDGAFDTKSAL